MKIPGRRFVVAACVLAGAVLALRLTLAAREWFISDDFYFLALVQDTHWSWSEVFMPTRPRLIAAYRPLGLESYFFVNFALFGWNAFGYYLSALTMQLLTGLMLARIALHYGFERRAAWASGLFVLLAGPSVIATYAVAEHNYICAALGYTCSVAWFLDALAQRRALMRWLSCLALLLGLLSNEVCASLPLVVFVAAACAAPELSWTERARHALHASWPQFVVAGLYVDFKFSGVPMRQENWFYDVDVSTDMLSNTLGNLAYVSGGEWRLLLLALSAAAGVWLGVRTSRPRFTDRTVAPLAVGGTWLFLTLLPFSVLALPASRFALLQLPAAGLLFGTLVDSALPRIRSELQSALVLSALVLLMPWSGLLHALHAPRGAVYRDAYAVLTRELPGSDATCVTIMCRAPQLASDQQCGTFKSGTFGGALWRAVVANRPLDVEFTDTESLRAFDERPESRQREDCQRYYLKPDLTLSMEAPLTTHTAQLLQHAAR